MMNGFRYSGVVVLTLLSAFAPAEVNAQEMARVHDALAAPRPLVLPVFQAPQTSQQRPAWKMGAQSTSTVRSERGVGRKVLGAVVGATGGLFAGGYLGATIEGDRCHCDDPGLQGALIGAPVGMVVGGILGALFLF